MVSFFRSHFWLKHWLTDLMAAARRLPLRISEPVDRACARVRAGIWAGGMNLSSVTNVWPTATKSGWPANVVALVLRNLSSRVERREMRSAARAAAVRARLRAGLGIAEARTAGAEYACDLLNFSASAEIAPSPNSEIVRRAVLEAEENDARRVLAQMEPRAGVLLERLLPDRSVEFVLTRGRLGPDVRPGTPHCDEGAVTV